jgi:hypothetical protein
MTAKDLDGQWLTKDNLHSMVFRNVEEDENTFYFREQGKTSKEIPYSLEGGLLIIKSPNIQMLPSDNDSTIKILYEGEQLIFFKARQ